MDLKFEPGIGINFLEIENLSRWKQKNCDVLGDNLLKYCTHFLVGNIFIGICCYGPGSHYGTNPNQTTYTLMEQVHCQLLE